ncbi:MAG TPA: hypothetical protein VFB29_06210 [Pseudolabrys sp.]|nr:hypothetical protein [Pseudolabrys sp.]
MPALLPVLFTASQLVLVADTLPKFDAAKACRAAAEASVSLGRSADDCKRDEEEARVQLSRQWDRYTATQRKDCVRLSSLGNSPSYVELLTCLEMAKQAKDLPESSGMGTSGQR